MATAALTSASFSRRTCLSALLGACATPAALALAPPARAFEPPLMQMRLRDAGAEAVRLQRVDLRADVVGHAAQMRIELVFFNPNGRVLEGELQFPLAHGQWVSGFELDIDGELRPVVVVDKARGQQVFEDVIRARVDPALLEATDGDNYKLRVYPLPAQGTRRVVLHIGQMLNGVGRDGAGRLDLPLRFADLPQLDVQVRVAGVSIDALTVSSQGLPAQAIVRRQAGDGWAELSVSAGQLQGTPLLVVTLPRRSAPVVATQRHAGREHFYAELPVNDAALAPMPRAKPRRIALLWDASGSGARRGIEAELAVLDAYFRALVSVDVVLHVGRDAVEPEQRFQVRGGQWPALRHVLETTAYDGASNLPALIKTEGCDIALLFSDGLSNWGTRSAVPESTVPLYALMHAGPGGGHTDRLRRLAERSGGEYLDLSSRSDAVQALRTRRPRLLRATGPAVREVVIDDPYAVDGHYRVAGVLVQPQAELTLEFERADGRTETRRLQLAAGDSSTLAAQRWASLRMAELQAGFGEARDEVRRLGRHYGLVSRETSLIVLEALNDYVRFEIEPPPSLRDGYQRAMAQAVQRKQRSQAQHLDGVVARFTEQVRWWEKDFPKDGAGPKAKQHDQRAGAGGSALGRMEMNAARDDAPRLSPAAPAPVLAERREASSADSVARKSVQSGVPGHDAAPAAVIRLQPWQPDVPYARRLRQATPEAVYRVYLEERRRYADSTAFFLDAADVLFARQQPLLAMRVLSNLAEMDLENRHILRVLAYRLPPAAGQGTAARRAGAARGAAPEPQRAAVVPRPRARARGSAAMARRSRSALAGRLAPLGWPLPRHRPHRARRDEHGDRSRRAPGPAGGDGGLRQAPAAQPAARPAHRARLGCRQHRHRPARHRPRWRAGLLRSPPQLPGCPCLARRDGRLRPGRVCAQGRQARALRGAGPLLWPPPAGGGARHHADAGAEHRLRPRRPEG